MDSSSSVLYYHRHNTYILGILIGIVQCSGTGISWLADILSTFSLSKHYSLQFSD